MEIYHQELLSQAQKQVKEMEAKEKNIQEILEKQDLRADTLKFISKEVAVETKKMKSIAVPVNKLFGKEEYIKVKKSDWDVILDVFHRAISRNYLLETYEKKIVHLENRITNLTGQVEKLKQFIVLKGLWKTFIEFARSFEPKSIKQKLKEVQNKAIEHNQQKKINQQELTEKKKWQQEM